MYLEDENGFITIPDNPISKAGIFDYLGSQISSELNPNKIYKVYRPESELNNKETIDSFKLVPWIPHHEMLGDDFTPAEEVGVQGITGEDVHYKDGTLYAKLKLLGKDLKEKIKNGLKELSCGFRCTWDLTAGITQDGEPYDVIQRNIRGNHLASVTAGRMGSDVRVAMDQIVINLQEQGIETNMDLTELIQAVTALSERMERIEGVAQDVKDQVTKQALDAKEKDDESKEKSSKKDDDEDEDDEDKEDNSKKDKSDSAKDESALKIVLDKFEKLEEKVKSISAMDSNLVIKEINERNDLAQQISNHIGQFDYNLMTKAQVADYALKKLGFACDSGDSLSIIKGYLLAQEKPKIISDSAQDQTAKVEIPELKLLGL